MDTAQYDAKHTKTLRAELRAMQGALRLQHCCAPEARCEAAKEVEARIGSLAAYLGLNRWPGARPSGNEKRTDEKEEGE